MRSRLLRLALEDTEDSRAVKRVLEYRLPAAPFPSHPAATPSSAPASTSDTPALSQQQPPARPDQSAFLEWIAIVNGTHPIWRGVPPAYKTTLRRFLIAFNGDVDVATGDRGVAPVRSVTQDSVPPM